MAGVRVILPTGLLTFPSSPADLHRERAGHASRRLTGIPDLVTNGVAYFVGAAVLGGGALRAAGMAGAGPRMTV